MRAMTRALADGPPVDPIAVAGEHGVYVASSGITLAGSGTAAVLPLPGGLGEPRRPPGRRALARCGRARRPDRVARHRRGGLRLPPLRTGLTGGPGGPGHPLRPERRRDRVGHGPRRRRVRRAVPGVAPRPVPVDPPYRAPPPAPRSSSPGPPTTRARWPRPPGRSPQGGCARWCSPVASRSDRVGRSSPSAMLRRMAEDEPSSTAFLLGTPDGAFVGASPELLVSRRGRLVLSHPLAGTVALDGASRPNAACSARPRTSRSTSWWWPTSPASSTPAAAELVVPGEPSLVRAPTMAHLGTRIEGRLMAEGGRAPSALELVAALAPHPGRRRGAPGRGPRAHRSALEPGPRGPWAGPVGWVDARGDGDWVVGLRSAIISGRPRPPCGPVRASWPRRTPRRSWTRRR